MIKLNKKRRLMFDLLDKQYRKIFKEIINEYCKKNSVPIGQRRDIISDLPAGFSHAYLTYMFEEWLKNKKTN